MYISDDTAAPFPELLEQDLHHALQLALLGGRQMIEIGSHRDRS
jgi:hypothetical protein